MVEKLLVALVGGWNDEERDGEKNCRNEGNGAGFWSILDPNFPFLTP
jgi:hypothetical protein